MSRRRTGQEIEELLESYRTSGMTRIAYCQQVGIALSTGQIPSREQTNKRVVGRNGRQETSPSLCNRVLQHGPTPATVLRQPVFPPFLRLTFATCGPQCLQGFRQ